MKTINVRLVGDGEHEQVMTLEEFGALHAKEQEQKFKDCVGKIQEFLDDKAAEQAEAFARGMEDGLA